MGCFAGGDLSRIEVDTVERVEPGQSGGKMGEDKTVTGPHLDDPPSTAPTRNHLRDMVDDAGMMTQEEILETVRETIEEVRFRRHRGPEVLMEALQGTVVARLDGVGEGGVANQLPGQSPSSAERFFIDLSREAGPKELQNVSRHGLGTSVEGKVRSGAVDSHGQRVWISKGFVQAGVSMRMRLRKPLPALPCHEGGEDHEQGTGNVGGAAHPLAEATYLAMRRAFDRLSERPVAALIDGNQAPDLPCPIEMIIDGDAYVASISAASIIAKVERDRMMVEFCAQYPGYAFAKHKGYGTPEHQRALAELGPCPIHRHSFKPVRQAAGIIAA